MAHREWTDEELIAADEAGTTAAWMPPWDARELRIARARDAATQPVERLVPRWLKQEYVDAVRAHLEDARNEERRALVEGR